MKPVIILVIAAIGIGMLFAAHKLGHTRGEIIGGIACDKRIGKLLENL